MPVPATCTAISPLVRRDDVVSGFSQHRQLVAPAICQFRKSVQQQQHRTSGRARFQQVHTQAGRSIDEAGAHAVDDRGLGICKRRGLHHST